MSGGLWCLLVGRCALRVRDSGLAMVGSDHSRSAGDLVHDC